MLVEGQPEHITVLAAGSGHSACLTAEGHLYMWGWNKYGQLGASCYATV